MFRKVFVFSLLVIFAVSLAGCATTACKQKDLELQGLKNHVSLLETQIQTKDEEIKGLQEAVAKSNEQQAAAISAPVTKETAGSSEMKSHRLTVKEIQTALKNAGYDPGKIDGHIGKQTRDALKAFQKAHNLVANGKSNKKTRDALSVYLSEKTK